MRKIFPKKNMAHHYVEHHLIITPFISPTWIFLFFQKNEPKRWNNFKSHGRENRKSRIFVLVRMPGGIPRWIKPAGTTHAVVFAAELIPTSAATSSLDPRNSNPQSLPLPCHGDCLNSFNFRAPSRMNVEGGGLRSGIPTRKSDHGKHFFGVVVAAKTRTN